MLELRDLVKHYRSGRDETVRALDGVSMTIQAGELVALYGPSGSGKTTLLSIVAALLPPDRGTVRLDGRELSSLSPKAAAHYRMHDLGYVSQAPDLLPGVPAIDNAALKLFGMRMGVREAHRRAIPLMERLGLGARLGHRPDQLSAGERQRVLIARALSTGPSLVLADEPTGSLDTTRSREVLTLLTEICHEQRTAMLLVTHDPRAASFASRVHALVDGQVVAYEPDDLGLPAPVPQA
ncbi:MAG TPA: ABC transporter ATP-binding protein [Thermoleophilaceae bacterium]|nr:ABC transporter ATP-binding protein [Thermoleophilaceae bacterium]